MNKNICLFITPRGSKPDLYINIIGYLITKYKGKNISSIVLLNIFDFPFNRGKEEERVELVKRNIIKQIKALTKGQYFQWQKDGFRPGEPEDVIISPYYKEMYQNIYDKIKQINIEPVVIFEDELEYELNHIVNNKNEDYIFDITG